MPGKVRHTLLPVAPRPTRIRISSNALTGGDIFGKKNSRGLQKPTSHFHTGMTFIVFPFIVMSLSQS